MNAKPIYIVEWTSPSNIALIKYWGKFGDQEPRNPSISFTLKNSVTTLSIEVFPRINPGEDISLEFFFEGSHSLKFQEKIVKFLTKEKMRFPWLETSHLKINSSNTFPHSSGIASSASSMSALCLSLLSVDVALTGHEMKEADFKKEASRLSRLASGSAARSIYPQIVSWGESISLKGSSNYFATPFLEAHPIFDEFCDSILIVDAKEKAVSSRAGHGLMENHPFSGVRYQQARENMDQLVQALKTGDLPSFIRIVEEEALTLHALMMTSRPSYILLKPESLHLIEEIRRFRENEQIPACFTIDAGPNIHLLYPKSHAVVVRRFIETVLAQGVPGMKWIHDEIGMGPTKGH